MCRRLATERARAHERVMGKRQLLNVLPNFAGVGAGFVFTLLFNAAYYRLLGSEGYGLVGFYGTLAVLASLLDPRLSQTTLREVARLSGDPARADELAALVLTFASISCGPGLLVGMLAVAFSQWLATSWLGSSQLSIGEIATAIAMMGGILAFIFPTSIFNAVLRGLQLQVLSNTVAIVAGASRGVGTIAALYLFGSTPLVFFSAQLLISALEVAVMGGLAWWALPRSSNGARFDFRLFQTSWRFTLTIWLSDLIGQLIMLSDRIVMSTLLPLDLFGLYSLAFAVASTVQRLVVPFSNAYLPHFVELLEKGHRDLLSEAYHLVTRISSAVVLCAGLLLMVYAKPIMMLLTGDAASTEMVAPVFALLAAANMLASLVVLPKALQFACGAAWIAFRISLIEALPYLALLLLLAPRFGMYAPAGLWLAASAINLPIITIMTHRVALRGQAWAWFRQAVLLPAGGAVAALALGAVMMPERSMRVFLLPWLALNYGVALVIALLCAFRGRFPRRQNPDPG